MREKKSPDRQLKYGQTECSPKILEEFEGDTRVLKRGLGRE
jgi:hypothetical protein